MQNTKRIRQAKKNGAVTGTLVNGTLVNGAAANGSMASPSQFGEALPDVPPHPELHGEELATAVRASVEAATLGIIEGIIAKARQGSYLHANFLFDFARISGAPTPQNETDDEPLARYLLEQLEAGEGLDTPETS